LKKNITKEDLRKEILLKKKGYTPLDLQNKSEEVFSILEITGTFQDAKTIFIYNSLSDEVSTSAFMDRWKDSKTFYLPVIVGGDIVFRPYMENTDYVTSRLGVKEPQGCDFTDYHKIDLVVVPGVAFDRKMNRLGRGKGYYDRFLPKVKAPKLGVCFDFQLLENIPHNNLDVKMDMIVSENDLIW